MSYRIDDRGSKDQRILYDFLYELYPGQDVIYEYMLYELNQRIDLYIPHLAIAIEYHGRQHYEFVPHFHKNIEEFKRAVKMDRQKSEYLYMHGIKLIEIPYNNMVTTKEELLQIIDSQDYPLNIEVKPLPTSSVKRDDFLQQQKQQRKESYNKSKDFYKESDEDRQDRLLLERKLRKEKYKKFKELKNK